jgi:hypothetical protein
MEEYKKSACEDFTCDFKNLCVLQCSDNLEFDSYRSCVKKSIARKLVGKSLQGIVIV